MNLVVSVIIPVYNVEKYLDDCLRGVVAQTLQEIEIILIDDGSPDRSGEICDEWAVKDSRIRVIHQMNQGVSAARNAGLEIAQGEFVGFVDSDDVIYPCMYEILSNKMRQAGVDFVECEHLNYDEGLSFEQVNSLLNSRNHSADRNISSQEADQYMESDQRFSKTGYIRQMAPSACIKLFRRSVIEQQRIRFQPIQKVASEDGLFCLEYLLNCHRMVHTSQVLYAYRQGRTSLTHIPRNGYTLGIVHLIQHLMEHQTQSMGRLSRQEKLVLFYYLYQMNWQRVWSSRKEIEHNLRDARTCPFFSWSMVLYNGLLADWWRYFLIFYLPPPWIAWLLWTKQETKKFLLNTSPEFLVRWRRKFRQRKRRS